MFTSKEQNMIEDWHKGLSHDMNITCLVSDDERTAGFRSFCEAFAGLAERISVAFERGDGAADLPGIVIHEGLIYHAVPKGPELRPFLSMLSILDTGRSPLSQDVISRLNELSIPCLLKLFIAPECPFCPQSVDDLAPLPLAGDRVTLKIIDGLLFPEMAQALDVRSAPTLIFDDRMRWTGRPALREVLDVVVHQDPSMLSPTSMESLLGEGKASLLAGMMIEQQNLFPALFDLLTHDKWPVRLGAMVTMEEIIEQDPALGAQCVNPLLKRFPNLDSQIQGDVVYILGEAGDHNVMGPLEDILTGPYAPEIREAAQEALDTIAQKE